MDYGEAFTHMMYPPMPIVNILYICKRARSAVPLHCVCRRVGVSHWACVNLRSLLCPNVYPLLSHWGSTRGGGGGPMSLLLFFLFA